MHSSAMRIGGKFFEQYYSAGMKRVLEVGSLDVNGSLRKHKPADVEWVGVDLEPGMGVDVVVQPHERLPFPDNYFDLVVATSVFEHDIAFWKTMAEMARVANEAGFIYISAPSNGMVHRYPLDVFRFYPDAGVALVNIAQEAGKSEAFLSESFTASQDHEGIWNDFVAVIGVGSKCLPPQVKIFEVEASANVWRDGLYLDSSSNFIPEDRAERDAVTAERDAVTAEREQMLASNSWKITKPLRKIASFLGEPRMRYRPEGTPSRVDDNLTGK